MNWKEVYEKCNHTEYSQLIEIREPVKIEGNFKKFFSAHKIGIIIFLIAFIVLSFITYKLEWKSFLAVAFVLLIAILFLVFYNSYRITIRKNKLMIRAELNDIEINTDDLVTIYLSKKKVFLFIIIPINVYYINIVYAKHNQSNPRASTSNGVQPSFNIITLPTIMNEKEDVVRFFKHFSFRKIEKTVQKNKIF